MYILYTYCNEYPRLAIPPKPKDIKGHPHSNINCKTRPHYLDGPGILIVNSNIEDTGATGPKRKKKCIKSGVVALSTCSGTWVGVNWLLVNKVKM